MISCKNYDSNIHFGDAIRFHRRVVPVKTLSYVASVRELHHVFCLVLLSTLIYLVPGRFSSHSHELANFSRAQNVRELIAVSSCCPQCFLVFLSLVFHQRAYCYC